MSSGNLIRGDATARQAWLRALRLTAAVGADPTLTLPIAIEQVAEKAPGEPALIGETEALSYQDLTRRARRYATWALDQGIGRGEVVGLLMRNSPEYPAIWLGITRIGGVVALLNTQLVGRSLAQAIDAAEPTHIISGAEFADAVDAVLSHLSSRCSVWIHGDGRGRHRRLDEALREREEQSLRIAHRAVPTLADRALCIYTSGTTGFPKAARVSHLRLLLWSRWFAGMMEAGPNDRMYNCLPMYHSVGGVVAVGAMLVGGGSVVIRERFSATRFWDDIAAADCTVFQYIGELCRYLVRSPPHPRETAHRLRLSCGNGLRPDIWQEFRHRFRIPRNLEFYASTEANFSLYNCEDEPGSIGRIPAFLAHRFPVALVKVDLEEGEPARNGQGFCLRCSPDEPGEAIAKLPDASSCAGMPFEGYTDPAASDKKVLRDVFATGDAWFRSGDLMRRDRRGFFYFVDRIGDTFRWKGENVSSTQVEEALRACRGVDEAVVYGISIPGVDGRAGMAALVVGREFDFETLRLQLSGRLPEHARPLFVRVRKAIQLTATFKPDKQQLIREGCDPRVTDEPIYVDDRGAGGFRRVDRALHRRITAGTFRL